MLSHLWTVLRKEILDARRDIKALAPGLVMPLLFAFMTYGSVHFLVSIQDQPSSFELAVQGGERAVPLMQALREAGIEVTDAPADPAEAVRSRQLDMVLVIPEDFNERFRGQNRAMIDLVWDVSRTDSHARANRVKHQINQWSSTTGSLRLLLRGVSPEVSQVLSVNDVNIATEQRMASRLFGALPMVILLLAFVAGAGMSSEMAAGERENRTLEPLLITPISHGRLFAGKWLASITVTFVLALLGVALQLLAVNAAPLEQLGLRSLLGTGDFVLIMVILLPIIALATALQLLVSFLSKSFKDAQSYNQILMLLPVVPGIYVLLSDSGMELWKMWVPLLGSQLLIVEIFSGQTVPFLPLLIAAITSLGCAAVCAFGAIGLMKRE